MAELLSVEESDAQDVFFERGWTDGLPVVPPTPARVASMLANGGVAGADMIGATAAGGRALTAEDVAICAVMAGCPGDCFPVVLAAVEAMLDPLFNAHTVLSSTGGAAVAVVVSGPIARAVGMNAGHSVLGP